MASSIDHPVHGPDQPTGVPSPADSWEERYAAEDQVWSGEVNRALTELVGALAPGHALDLGCGEGADVLWLAQRGWRAHGIDISPTAVARGRELAARRGLTAATFSVADLESWEPQPASVDLVTASFLQSRHPLRRIDILRRATSALRDGGHLVVLAHAAPPSWADHHPGGTHPAAEQLAELSLPTDRWVTVLAEDRPRAAISPDGAPGEHVDAVLMLRRRQWSADSSGPPHGEGSGLSSPGTTLRC